MAKNCPHCMTELPDNATFCYECGKPQPGNDKDDPRPLPRWMPIAAFFAILLCLFGVYRMMQPKTYMGGYEVDYVTKEDITYHLTLSFGTIDEACESMAVSGGTPVTTYLYVTDTDGNPATETFLPLVEDIETIGLPVGGAFAADMAEIACDADGWSCTASNDSTSGSNIIRWTLDMENGDTIILSHSVEYTE